MTYVKCTKEEKDKGVAIANMLVGTEAESARKSLQYAESIISDVTQKFYTVAAKNKVTQKDVDDCAKFLNEFCQ